MSQITTNLRLIHEGIARACDRAGRDPASVTLIAVSKTFGIEAIEEAYGAGHRHFGESRLQEALPKIEALPADIVWHFIGPLQSNKAKRVASLFHVVHSFENEGQIREAGKAASNMVGLLEVNIADEPQKRGLRPSVDALRRGKEALEAEGIAFGGLMTIGPLLPSGGVLTMESGAGAPQSIGAERMRPCFRWMFELNQELGGRWLSMGMSEDFEVAVEERATHVRVGSAIFGVR